MVVERLWIAMLQVASLVAGVDLGGVLLGVVFSVFCVVCLTQLWMQKHAAALYAQAADFNKTARFYYMKAQDAYYLANAQASYDDWRRARRQWDYFYRRK